MTLITSDAGTGIVRDIRDATYLIGYYIIELQSTGVHELCCWNADRRDELRDSDACLHEGLEHFSCFIREFINTWRRVIN